MKKAIALFLVLSLALLSACKPKTNVPNPPPSTPAAQEPGENQEILTQEALDAMGEIAHLYECSYGGGALLEEEAMDPVSGIAFHYLFAHDLLAPYANKEQGVWEVPYGVQADVNRLFFASLGEMPQEEREFCIAYADSFSIGLPYQLAREEARVQEDGTIVVTYRREREGVVLTPVTYRFRPGIAEEVPQVLSGLYKSGDAVYRIVSVTQRPDLLPEVQSQTIEIATAEELLAAAQRINEGRYGDQNDVYLLTADIDLAGVEWTPMGLNGPVQADCDPNLRGFNGTFDGQGHAIRNLTITEEQGRALLEMPQQNSPGQKVNGVGLFYSISSQGVVKNLRLENATVLLPLEGKEYGASAGLLAAFCGGRLENVSVQGRVQGVAEVGGLAGSLWGAFGDETASLCGAVNCSADAEVTGFSEVGGLTGTLYYATLRDCSAKGTVTSDLPVNYQGDTPRNIGGLMGHCLQGWAENCRAGAAVFTQVSSRCVGSLCGLAEGGRISGCSVDSRLNANWEAIDAYYRMDFEPEVERS